jgi:hypothetical protein
MSGIAARLVNSNMPSSVPSSTPSSMPRPSASALFCLKCSGDDLHSNGTIDSIPFGTVGVRLCPSRLLRFPPRTTRRR